DGARPCRQVRLGRGPADRYAQADSARAVGRGSADHLLHVGLPATRVIAHATEPLALNSRSHGTLGPMGHRHLSISETSGRSPSSGFITLARHELPRA